VSNDLDRFLALVCRELAAVDACVVEAEDEAEPDGRELRCAMVDGRSIVARFDAPPADREARQRRLEMLASTFDALFEESTQRPRHRSSPVRSLRDELAAMAARAGALNAVVIDANSPVVWGAAQPQGVIVLRPRTSGPSLRRDAEGESEPDALVGVASRRAINSVRALPEVAELRKGRHLRHLDRGGDPPFIVHSFAGIYLLVVIFGAPLDELRAERAIFEALPRVERLVLALPPLDPVPIAGAIAMRRRKRG
jgi:hypothetical protein